MVRQLPSKPLNFSDLFEEYGTGSIARLPKHCNGGFELHYIEKGCLHWEIEGQSFVVPPGSVFFTFPWEKHGSIGEFEPGHFFHFAVFRLKQLDRRKTAKVRLIPAFSLSEKEQGRIFSKLLSLPQRCFPASRDLAWTMMRLVRELTEPGPMGRTHVLALAQAALCELIKSISLAQAQAERDSPGQREVLKLLENLRLDCARPWTLDSMAAACRLKRTQFETLTKKLTGDTPFLLLNRFRIQRSLHLLRNSNKTITEIAFEVGFESSQYFARVFQKLTGLTPSSYRRSQNSLAIYDRRFLAALEQLR